MGDEAERLEGKLDELAARLASDLDAPDELVAVALSEIETTKEQLRQALSSAESESRDASE